MKANRLYPREILYTVSSWFSILPFSLFQKSTIPLFFLFPWTASEQVWFNLRKEEKKRKRRACFTSNWCVADKVSRKGHEDRREETHAGVYV